MSKITLDRIHGHVALSGLLPERMRVDGGEARVELSLSEDHAVEVYFPTPRGEADNRWVEQAREVLMHLAEMDNAVQRSCAEECARSGLHSRNYESHLAYITLAGPDAVVLHYCGAVVNTEWDEPFVRVDGRWVPARTA